jgi:sulfatase modifying factor 1
LFVFVFLLLVPFILFLNQKHPVPCDLPTTPGNPELEAEIARLRGLEAQMNLDQLVDILDHSMVTVPGGEFLRGSNKHRWDETPEALVYLDVYALDRYEVTNLQYRRFLLATGGESPPYWTGNMYPPGQGLYPVVGVTWDEAVAYCQWAGKRLPTEAEWEKACRSADGRLYPWGNAWDPRRGNIDLLAGSFRFSDQLGAEPGLWKEAWSLLQAAPADPGGRGLRPVGCYLQGASPYGALDMVGNASEWVADWYINTNYSNLPTRNPITLSPHWNHALRGSSWYDPNGSMTWIEDQSRCSARNSSHERLDARVGFRCAQ